MRRIIVDGYNVIKCDEHLQHLQRQSLGAARRGLIARLCEAQRLRCDDVTVVFDGWQAGAGYQSATREQGIRVVYSPRGERADEVIKRLVAGSPDPAAVVVVSNDRELRVQTARGGAQGSGSQNLMRQATPARRARLARPAFVEPDKDSEDAAYRHSGSAKKGPARRLPRAKRSHLPPDYRF
jgi:predicted RNA-binding protein with PIN domain